MDKLRVICVDASQIRWPVKQLKEGNVYTLRGVETYGKGEGYLLEEISNSHIQVLKGGVPIDIEAGYKTERFIPLSNIDETNLVREFEIAK